MKRNSNVLTADHPTRGLLWAAFDPSARYIVPTVAHSRWSARMAPFNSEDEARKALAAACSQAGAES
jgi:hypothetical protein